MAWLHTHATVFCSSGEVTCQPFPPVRGFGILSGVSHHKSYTVIVGGSMSKKAFHSMDCMKVCLYDLLVCCRIGWRQLDFSWAYPFIERDSKESEHIQIIIWDRLWGRWRTAWIPKSPSECRTVGRTGRESVESWVTENEREDPRGSCLTVVRSECRRHNKINWYIGYGKLQRSTW